MTTLAEPPLTLSPSEPGTHSHSKRDIWDTDPHIETLARFETETAAIRYAVATLNGASTAEVMAWLAGYGYTVSSSKVYPEVRAYRDARGLTDDDTDDPPAQPAIPTRQPEHRDTSTPLDRDTSTAPVPSAPQDTKQTIPTVPNVSTAPTGQPRQLPVEHSLATAQEQREPWVALACYAAALMSLAVSLNTSWRFFATVLHIPTTNGERYIMFAVAELALVVCGAGMAVNVHHHNRPGSFRMPVWAMCTAMAYMAWAESTPEEAIGRILLGPVLGTTMLHLGLGLELRTHHQHTGTAARIGYELRERCLSRLGLANDERDAAQRTRDRAARKVAALSQPQRWPWTRQARLQRALLAAGVADDPAIRSRMLTRLAVIHHAHELSTLTQPSPWTSSDLMASSQ